MRRFSYILLLVFFCTACDQQVEHKPALKKKVFKSDVNYKIAVFTDLIDEPNIMPESATYPGILTRYFYDEGYKVQVKRFGQRNLGVKNALSELSEINQFNPDIVFIAMGLIDSTRNVSPKQIRYKLDEIVRYFKSKKKRVVLAGMKMSKNLIASSGSRRSSRRRGGPRHNTTPYYKQFADIFPHIARRHDIGFVKYLYEPVYNNIDYIDSNNLYLFGEGHKVMADYLLITFLEIIQEMERYGKYNEKVKKQGNQF